MRHLSFFTTSLLISLVAFGCDVEPELVDSEEEFDMILLEQDNDGDELDVRTFSKDELEEAVPGESFAGPSAAAGCVYVQWCDAPGQLGTICRLRSGCQITQATLNECFGDANAVCGGLFVPWTIY